MNIIFSLVVGVFFSGQPTFISNQNSDPSNTLLEKIRLLDKDCDSNNLRCLYWHKDMNGDEDQLYLTFSADLECTEVHNLMLHFKRKSESAQKIAVAQLNIDGQNHTMDENWMKRIKMGGRVSHELNKFVYQEDYDFIESIINSSEASITISLGSYTDNRAIIQITPEQKKNMQDVLYVFKTLKSQSE